MVQIGLIKKLVNGKIKNKLVLYTIILLLGNIVVIGMISYAISTSAIMDKISTTNSEILKQSIDNIDFIFKSIENTAIQVFDDFDLVGQIDRLQVEGKSAQTQVDQKINNVITELMNIRNEIDYVYVILNNYSSGEVTGIYSNERFARLQVIKEGEFEKLLDNNYDKFVWTYMVKEGLDIQPDKKIALCRAIIDKDNVYRGFILITLRDSVLKDIYSNIEQQKCELYLVDNERTVVSSPNTTLVGNKIPVDYEIAEVNSTSTKIIDNKKYLITNMRSQHTGWRLYIKEPYENIVSIVRTIGLGITVAASTGIVVFIILSILLSNTLTKPIKKLEQKASSISNSNENLLSFSENHNNGIRESAGLFKKFSFRKKLLFMLITLIIIPVMFLMGVSYFVSFKVIKEKSIAMNLLNTKQINIKLNHYLVSFEKCIYDLYGESDLNNLLRNLAFTKKDDIENIQAQQIIQKVFVKMLDKNRDIVYTQLFNNEGKQLSYYGSHRQVIPEELFNLIDGSDNPNNIWYGPYTNYYNQKVITLGKKLKDVNDFVDMGYMFISIKETDIEQVYVNRKDNKGYTFITDRNGVVLSHPDKALLQTKADYIFRKPELFVDIKSLVTEFNDDNVIISCDTLESTGWKVYHVSSLSFAKASMKQMLYYYIIMFILNTAVIAVISLRVSRKVGKPINELSKKVVDFANSNTNPSENEFTTGDEIEQLNRSFTCMMKRIKTLIEEVYEAKLREREAEIYSKETELTLLQAQINPHFLYNTLEIIRWKAMFLTNGENEVTDIVSTLSDFFRLSLSRGKKMVTLKDEIEHASNYVAIMNYRYSNKIILDWSVDEDVKDSIIPKIVLQPILENAIYHGIKPKGNPGSIGISIVKCKESIRIVVEDNGIGMSSEKLEIIKNEIESINGGDKNGYGLRNINQRLKLAFGENYGISIVSTEGEGTEVCLNLPKSSA